MNRFLSVHDWLVIEDGYHRDNQKRSESLFSLGNGYMGMRANHEETYSGPSLKGSYLAGIYYPDKTRVGWWKVGYPEYFAKVLNAPNWIGFRIFLDGKEVDLDRMVVGPFRRMLDMRQGILSREFTAGWSDGTRINVHVERFLSMHRKETGCIRYRIKPLNFSPKVVADLFVDGDVRNEDSNYGEQFWEPAGHGIAGDKSFLTMRTRKSGFLVCHAMYASTAIEGNGEMESVSLHTDSMQVSYRNTAKVESGAEIVFTKLVSVTNSREHDPELIDRIAVAKVTEAAETGYEVLRDEHVTAWDRKWQTCDVRIGGDPRAQQGIRFNIFHLNQTYTGQDPTLNIGPKGFTGEKYGGGTYWDTEALCLPFYLGTCQKEVGRNLLIYRYKHLQKAIENASLLGFFDGAALYPMVTMNGEECHNEWEITFEEVHRNGAIAYAIYRYVRQTGDFLYLSEFGAEVLIAISRFWSQRFSFADRLGKYVMLGVTGPNEYENNVNNNWYTNYIAAWTLAYTIATADRIRREDPEAWHSLTARTNFRNDETLRWESIIRHVYLPEDPQLGIFVQQDGYLEKVQTLAADLDPADRPLNQHWSWDRILRSSLIKQADVLMGLYLFEERFDRDTIRRNFDFYEPRTVHESSLSPSVHAILAARLGYSGKAHELFMRASRLDLDDYNHEIEDGCHVTSMAGAWMAVVEGFAGMRVAGDGLSFEPVLPDGWTELSFNVHFRGTSLHISFSHERFRMSGNNQSGLEVSVNSRLHTLQPGQFLDLQL